MQILFVLNILEALNPMFELRATTISKYSPAMGLSFETCNL